MSIYSVKPGSGAYGAAAFLCAFAMSSAAGADGPSVGRQNIDDAWWTGPIISQSPVTMPKGHFYLEPYFYDVQVGTQDFYGSRAYMLYGLTDGITVGLLPIVGYYRPGGADNATSVELGDLTLLARIRLTSFDAETFRPATSLGFEWSLPTGKHDRLDRLGDGVGNGTKILTASFAAQEIFWLPNGRLVRSRINVMRSFPGTADIEDVSVYGTPEGFVGEATPGKQFTVNTGWEYSVSQNWVLALDVSYTHTGKTEVTGILDDTVYQSTGGAGDSFAIAPAIEYNWSASFGIIAGVRFIPDHDGQKGSVTPVTAISMFF